MRYVRKADVPGWLEARMDVVGSIDKTGSVRGMQRRFNWPKGGQIRVGGYIYNVGPEIVARLRDQNLLKGT